MRVLLSQPLTGAEGLFPAGACVSLGNERQLISARKSRRWFQFDGWDQVRLAVRLLRNRTGNDVIVTGRYGELFAAAQGVLPVRRTPHLLLDVEWPRRHTQVPRRWVSQYFHQAVGRGAWKIQVFCEAEADNYAAHFGIDRKKFVWIPYCTDVGSAYPAVPEADYVFSGGVQQRDYQTLLSAAERLPMRIRIAAPQSLGRGRPDPANTTWLGNLSGERFLSEMAAARLVVLSLEPGHLRYPGIITYVLALRLGKCVIVNDPVGAKSYIIHGHTGLMVPARDARALAEAVAELWDDNCRRRIIAQQARDFASRNLSPARYRADVTAAVAQIRGA